jgi:glutathionylspermidine synthase
MKAVMTWQEIAEHEEQVLVAEVRSLKEQLESLKSLVTWCQEQVEDEGTVWFARLIAQQAGASGTVGAKWDEMVATANRIVGRRDLVNTLAILATKI